MKRHPYLIILLAFSLLLAACSNTAPAPTPTPSPKETSTKLKPGEIFEDSSGLVLAVAKESLSDPVDVTVNLSNAAPELPLSLGLTALSDYFEVKSGADLNIGNGSLVLGLPVPESAKPDDLKIAVLLPINENFALHEQTESWQLVNGIYDAEHALLLIPQYVLSQEGSIYVLVEDDLSTRVKLNSALSAQLNTQAAVPEFLFNCYLSCLNSDLSIKPFVTDISQFLSDSYTEFTAMGFNKPAIQEELTGFNWGSFSFTYKDVFEVDLRAIFNTPNKNSPTEDCESANDITNRGVYKPSSRLIVICIDTAKGNDFSEDTVRHEYFHATQYAYGAMRENWARKWFAMVEGTATLAGASPKGALARDNREPLPVDVSLVAFSDQDLYQYRSQDFYYFVADSLNKSDLKFLKSFLNKGVTTLDISQAIASFNHSDLTNLKTAYWAWAKNQAFEKTFNPDGYLGNPCNLHKDVATPSQMRFYSNESVFSRESSLRVSPLTSEVIEFRFEPQVGSYQANINIDTTGTTGLKVKLYDPANCSAAQEQTSLQVNVPVNTQKVVYALISNVEYGGKTQTFKAKHNINFDGVALTIDQPTTNNFTEADDITLKATLSNVDSSKYLIRWSYDDDGVLFVLATSKSGESKTINLCDGIYNLKVEAFAPLTGVGSTSKNVELKVADLGLSTPPARCAPKITIAEPLDGANFALGDTVNFSASFSDDKPKTDTPLYPIIWRLGGKDGLIIARDTTSFSRAKFSEGPQRIYVEYGSSSDEITINIVNTTNTKPSVTITSPNNGETFTYFDDAVQEGFNLYLPLNLAASVSDPEDGSLPSSSIQWQFKDPARTSWTNLLTGANVTNNFNFFAEQYSMSFRVIATDSGGLSTTSSPVTISVIGPPN